MLSQSSKTKLKQKNIYNYYYEIFTTNMTHAIISAAEVWFL